MQNPKTAKGTELPLLNLKGKPYLQVPWRVLWFCEEKPDWSIETEIIKHDEAHSIVRAMIKDPSGRIIRTATKQETKQGFADHLEKAETGAIGRALGLMGYGTQFALELEEGERIVDAPIAKEIEKKSLEKIAMTQQMNTALKTQTKPIADADSEPPPYDEWAPPPGETTRAPVYNHAPKTNGPSEAQIKRLWAMSKNLDWSAADTITALKQQHGKDKPELLTREEYTLFTSKLQVEIDKLKGG